MSNESYLGNNTMLQDGKYRIVRFLGAGGFGCTYEAIYEPKQQRVAIKEFFPHELCNRDSNGCMSVGADTQVTFVSKLRKKFVDEAKTLFHFNHIEKIVKVTDIFDENGTSYFTMDYIEGQSLQKKIEKNGKLIEELALGIINEVCLTLECVHKYNFLHLDIKPDNIMMRPDGHIVLIDFGISKHYNSEDGQNKSTLMGCTPGYAPLEQMNANVVEFKPATDIYALGATLYAMLTGCTPPKATELLNETATLSLPDEITKSTRYAIECAMKSRIKDRPQSIREFLHILKGGDSKTIFFKKNGGKNYKKWGYLFAGVICLLCVVLMLKPQKKKGDHMLDNIVETAGMSNQGDQDNEAVDVIETIDNSVVASANTSQVEESQPLNQESKKQESKIVEKTPAEKFEMAVKNNDIDLLIELGNNNYVDAYIPLANHFLALNTPSADIEADKWAKKAMDLNKTEAQSVINELEKRGLYD